MPSSFEVVVVTPFQQNCSIHWDEGSRKALVVDPGGDVPEILARLATLDLEVEAILLTHGHLDHAGGVQELRQALMRQALMRQALGSPVSVIGPDRRDDFLLSGIASQAAALGITGMRDASTDRHVEEGEVLELAGRRLEVLWVPGHTPGHVVFFDRAARLLIAGDTLFQGSVGRTDFPYGDGPLLARSIKEKLFTLGDDVTVLPGHGGMTRIGEERAGNPFLR